MVDMARSRASTGETRRRVIIAAVAALVTALWVWVLIEGTQIERYKVPSEAMQPTYPLGSKVTVDKSAYDDRDPEINDIVLFHPPAGAEQSRCGLQPPRGGPCPRPTPERSGVTFIKRIVAGPGDTLSIRDGHAVVDGAVAEEDFTEACNQGSGCNLPVPITIPPDHYFVLGDNRPASDDSRFWGPVPREWLIGMVDQDTGPLGFPSTLLFVAMVVLLITYLSALVVAALKRRWPLFAIGLFIVPVAVLGALAEPKPGSYWLRRKQSAD
jgi:signal peptidase I